MSETTLTRRQLLAGGMTLGAAGLLAACVGTTSGGGGGGGSAGTGAVTLQNSIQDADPKAALEALVKAYQGGDVTLNSVATEQFRAQLTNYLRSGDSPEVLSWYAGSVARAYADEGLLLDVSSLWEGDGPCAGFSDALRSLSSDASGAQIFVPTNYYWWSVFYKRSAFEKWGVEPPTTWDEFHALCENLSGQGVAPLANGLSSTPWMASGWFDYLDLRLNGAQYHRELLAGEHAFNDPEVVAVMEEYKRLVPYFDKNAASYTAQEAATPVAQDATAMYLVGAFVSGYFPEDQRDDLDFFSVPVIDDAVPTAEEAPTDGFFAAARSDNHEGALDLLAYLASADAQQQFIERSRSSNLPTSPDVDTSAFSPLVQKGIALLNDTEEITQFFNRDSSDALQATADTALTKFLADPDSLTSILDEWQTAAEGVRGS
ncbi:ABC transporter substrate-binding protein [Promicromonospora citrea]|uniref:ABC transporter substrate-binding protein n=1 Tax=Promicromonospora citrea TaxID=43677 RepID=A0A8H9GEU6_9MICO|nr:ABC transporter substrate-binding protein [Promicromonospora citrea]NNH52110.1 carbohydrate ABC transporter substrate-binding protein [Promicromonospora citrea]GGM17468.1 ABC transporter substrate-binding protein [Promicromonospora citrea]